MRRGAYAVELIDALSAAQAREASGGAQRRP